MKKMIKSIIIFAILVITACGGDKNNNNNNNNETSSNANSSSQITFSSSKLEVSSNSSSQITSSSSKLEVSSNSSSIKHNFIITFRDENGNVLDTRECDEGTTPNYNYEVKDTEEWDYTFVGWAETQNGEVVNITAATKSTTYYAIVTKVKQQYTITFESNGGSAVTSITDDYGAKISKPENPTKDGYKFIAWTYDAEHKKQVEWPITLTEDLTLYASYNEKVNIKQYLSTLLEGVYQDPYSFIPEQMRPTYAKNHVDGNEVQYDFSKNTKVADIVYGGYGEQWNMVVENINQSEIFYSVLTSAEAIINSSVVIFNNYLDKNTEDTANHQISESNYIAMIDFSFGTLTYVIEYKTSINIPLIGEVNPQIAMVYDVINNQKIVRIQLNDNNALKYISTENAYQFAIEYGISGLSRKALFQIVRNEENIEGHIYEFIQLKDQDVIGSCADFYINEDYVSVVGNKASGMLGFKGYIVELYKTDEGKLLAYEVRETLSILGVSGTYNTLWFNLNDISGITSIKAIENENFGEYGNNNHDIYVNGSSSIFEPTKNKILIQETSRKYDIELRKQYFYGYDSNNELVVYEVNIPMMFIQADNDKDTNFTDFPSDIYSKNKINASVNVDEKDLSTLQENYAIIVDVFIANKDIVTGETITQLIELK